MSRTQLSISSPMAVLALVLTLTWTAAVMGQEPSSRLVQPEWLAANLTNPNVRIIDMRGDIRDYWETHIPGAVFLDSEALHWPDKGVPSKLMPPSALAQLLGEMGVGRDTTVIIYSEINHYRATYMVWALDYIKHRSWAILQDGFQGWKKQGRTLTQEYPKIKPVRYEWKAETDPDVRAGLDDVKNRNVAKSVLLDIRPIELFSGEKGSWKRKGHIKGAIHRFWIEDLNNNGTWKDVEVLKRTYADMGVTVEKTIIVSCGQGQTSSHVYFTLKYILGFPRVKNYDGSFSEWSNIDSLPVETGPQKTEKGN